MTSPNSLDTMDSDSSEWASEPIAVIGMSCNFSGGASNPDKLWDLMASGKTGWSEIPEDRYNLKGVYHSNHERNSTTHVKGGHFLDGDVAAFDAAFFNYSAEMAQAVDPQFRLQLESTYEALENAGLPLSQVMGSQTSVFAGVFTHDYQEGIIRDEDRLPRFNVVGTWSPMSSNRISHFFDFRGASMTLETGCSTTLVALHQAVHTLRNREADMSVVTGANVMLNPDTFKAIGSLGMLSPDGRSYTFDSRANGYGRGEGVATIIIKRLSDALAANDPIRAVIRETALNQDGKTDTITTPSAAAQVELMRECYRRAGLDPRGTQYFEAHGTGTPTGDPIEAGAMAAIFGAGEGRHNEEYYLRIGSVKTNVGHTEAASGLAAMVKGVLCLEKALIPPTVNYETPNPKLKLDEWHLKVVRRMEQWPDSLVDGPRRMSINNFGYGGANAHVILESADPWTLTSDLGLNPVNGNGHISGKSHINGEYHSDHTNDDAKVLILSARDERGCKKMVSDLKAYLEERKSLSHNASEQLLRNLSYTLGERRSLLQWVVALQVRLEKNGTLDTAIQALDPLRLKPSRRGSDIPRIGMIFTGQGAQWHAMGRELLTSYPIFRRSIDEAEAFLQALGADWSLLEELQRDAKTTRVHATKISIPVCVALQIALVRLLESWGIVPSAVASHSSGEIAAAFAVGALTHRQAMATAYYRATLVADETQRVLGAARGAMAAVGLGVDAVQPYLDRLTKDKGKAVVACINSPQSVTISGDSDAVKEIEDMCQQDDVFARRLRVQQAYHSHHMDAFADAYRESLKAEMARDALESDKEHLQAAKQELRAVFSSAVTGGRITDLKDIASPNHWVGSLVQPVRFVDAFTEMVLGDPDDPTGRSVDVLLEVGPHTALGGPIHEILTLPEFEGIDLPYWGCLVRDQQAGDTMRLAAINLFRQGQPLAMNQINFPVPAYDDESPQVLTDLPSYPWNHSIRHWQESRVNRAIRERSEPPHELLGMPVAGNDPSTAVWRRILRVSETPWVRDHMVQGSIVYPGSGYICLAIEAARQLDKIGAMGQDKSGRDISGFRLRDVNFLFALVIPDNADGVEIRTTLQSVPEREIGARGWWRFEVSSVTLDNRWTLHANGLIMVERETTAHQISERRQLSTHTRQPAPQDLFASLRARSVHHGPLFQNTTKIIQDGREPRSVCDITIRHEASSDTDPVTAAQNTLIHPITLDAVVVAFYSALPSVGALQEDPKLPRSVASMWVSNNISHEIGHTLQCDTSLVHHDAQSGRADITVFDGETDAMVLKIQGVELVSLGRGSGATARRDAANNGDTVVNKWEQELCSNLVWGPDLWRGNPLALEQLKEQLVLTESDFQHDMASNVERLCVRFAQDALQALTSEDVTRLQEHPHLTKYYTWLQELVARATKDRTLDGPKECQQLITPTASHSVDEELICHLGPLLPSILRGESNVEEVSGLLDEYNAKAMRQSSALRQLSTLLRELAHKNPAARILQIGNGFGARATSCILETLGTAKAPLVTSWHITEPSSKSLENTRTQLAPWVDLLEFDQLDIKQSPSKQGFTLGSYDVVVAFQALHAVEDVTNVLANVRGLLKPSGKFLFVETTKTQADANFVFGLLPEWWQSEESGRSTLTVSSWDTVLQDAGFSGVDLESHDSKSDDLYANSIIMSTVPLTQDQRPNLSRENLVVVTSSKTPVPQGFVDLLSQGIQASTGSNAPAPEHLVLEQSNLDAYKNKVCIFLGEIDKPVLADVDTVLMEGLRGMVTQCSGLLWVTTGGTVESESPERALYQGFLRVLRNEYIGRRFISLDLDPAHAATRWSLDMGAVVSAIVQVLEERFGHADTEVGPADFEYAERGGVLQVPRYYKDEPYNDMVTGPLVPSWAEVLALKEDKASVDPFASIPLEPLFQEDQSLRLELGIPGHLDTLAFVQVEESREMLTSELVEITPRAYGVCSRDVMAAMGQLKDRSMAFECAGIITRVGTEALKKGYSVGNHVMALSTGASFASSVCVPWHSVFQIPSSMDFTTAASLPLAFTIAYIGLVETARITAGQSVLIHAAAGAVGQATIMLAKHLGITEIYATAGSQEKRDFLQREYGIPSECIFNSRNASFASAVLVATKGHGVQVVLNSLPGPLLQASLSVLGPLGYLIEIGKKDIENNSLMALDAFSRGVSFVSLDIPSLLRHRGPAVNFALGEISRLIEQQVVKPVHPITVYRMQEAQDAFRFVQTGVQMGKVVLSAGIDEQVHVVPRPKGVTARAQLRPDASYLVVGGVGGIGRSITHWLVAHGAKNLILLSRSAGDLDLGKNKDSSGALLVHELRKMGCRVKPISCDIALPSSLTMALRACEDDGFPPVRGVVQGAMLLRDAIFEQMTLDDWHGGLRPKLYGTWNLHTEFSQQGSLDFFVMLSSVSGVVGIASQTNYAAGGSYQDAMARWRQSQGLPGVSIDLGPISDIGYVSTSSKVAERLRKDGDFSMLDEDIVLRALNATVLHPLGARSQIIVGLNSSPGPQWDVNGRSQLGRDARFIPLRPRRKASAPLAEGESTSVSLSSQLAKASDRQEGTGLIGAAIASRLADIFMTPVGEIDLGKPPAHFGVDSLIAVELRNMLVLQAAADVSIFNILQAVSLAALAELVAEKSHYLQDV
ncbi:acyl transferase acyl hydrolase lysophospholipase [Fusarium mexicanum]|uniref:Acyl transferase acyl hydrolase lysophospholipase n=1 Tax=Fusarium mexicanum TaxID=751941 RepID=A0A8H5JAH8_9HYPO|nr:acyl transferase acyl hydrolase lysophospholipase [Fusarium mexicanum]